MSGGPCGSVPVPAARMIDAAPDLWPVQPARPPLPRLARPRRAPPPRPHRGPGDVIGGDLRWGGDVTRRLADSVGAQQRGVGRAGREEGAVSGQVDEDDRLAARQVDAEAAAAGADGGGVEDVQDLADEVAGRRGRGGRRLPGAGLRRRRKKKGGREGREAKRKEEAGREQPHARPNVLLNRSSTWRRWC